MFSFYFLLFMYWLFVFNGASSSSSSSSSSSIEVVVSSIPDESAECGGDSEVNSIKSEIQLMRDGIMRELRRIAFGGGMCPPGFTYLPDIQNCYKVVYENLDWASAQRRCQQLYPDAHLITITTQKENDSVKKFLRWDLRANSNSGVYHLWIGLQRMNVTCHTPFVWKLPDGDHLPLGYSDWRSEITQQPDCYQNNEHCAHLEQRFGFRWNDHSCGHQMNAVCEYDLESPRHSYNEIISMNEEVLPN